MISDKVKTKALRCLSDLWWRVAYSLGQVDVVEEVLSFASAADVLGVYTCGYELRAKDGSRATIRTINACSLIRP